ncbi:hypothetical protein FM107_07060 [Sphingobacterium sp. JB170]|nr:hypothetical protein FM107_07060 [Sphingobacterium sp. JB170]
MASSFPFSSTTHQYRISSVSKIDPIKDEKIITNVKVFYNPVAEQITMTFKLSKQNNVTIKVMDALGNEVLNLMNGSLEAGIQSLSFEANGKVTTGVYFVRVSSNAETVVKRISVR